MTHAEEPTLKATLELVRELRLRQATLEAQNEVFRRAEADLNTARARYIECYDLAPVCYLILDARGRVLEANLTSAALLGVLRSTLILQPITRFILESDQELYERQRIQALRDGQSGPFEIRMRRPDGSNFWAHMTTIGALDEDGAPVWRVVVLDISDQKRSETLLLRSETDLKESQGLAHIAGWEWDAARDEMNWSDEFAHILGLPPGRTSMTREESLLLYVPSAGEALDALSTRAMLTGEPYEIILEVAAPATGTRWVLGRGEVHRDASGAIQGLRGTLQDITERKRAETEGARLQDQLLQANRMESLGSLAGGVAHDMNNVLAAILSLATVHLEIQVPGSPVHQAFEIISQAATRGGAMMKRLLGFARTSPVEVLDLDMNALVRAEIALLERTTLYKVTLAIDLAEGLRPIRGDPAALSNALMNLCVNAVDAMPGSGTLTLRTRNLGLDWIEVRVSDTGTGMPKEILAKALDPYFTTKDVGKGTGLGLPLAYSTVRAHGGELEILSRPGVGTRVKMRFPACTPAAPIPVPGAGLAPGPDAPSMAILLVDDDELVRASTGTILEFLGHTTTLAPSGEKALAEIGAGYRPDLVILDMNMPGLGGSGTLPRLRTLLPEVPVLLATGRADQAALELILAHPHVTLLSKPYSLDALRTRLKAAANPLET